MLIHWETAEPLSRSSGSLQVAAFRTSWLCITLVLFTSGFRSLALKTS